MCVHLGVCVYVSVWCVCVCEFFRSYLPCIFSYALILCIFAFVYVVFWVFIDVAVTVVAASAAIAICFWSLEVYEILKCFHKCLTVFALSI